MGWMRCVKLLATVCSSSSHLLQLLPWSDPVKSYFGSHVADFGYHYVQVYLIKRSSFGRYAVPIF